MSTTRSLSFVHLSDTHLGPSDSYLNGPGLNPAERARRVVNRINSLHYKPAFAIHTGDVLDESRFGPEGYDVATRVFRDLNIPILFIPGNHDDPATFDTFETGVRGSRVSQSPPTVHRHGGKGGRFDYSFAVGGYRGLVLDARINERAKGDLKKEQLDRLREFASADDPFLLFLHYAPVDIGVQWYRSFENDGSEDTMLISDPDALENVLVEVRHKVLGVFFGHVHCSRVTQRNGVLYTSAPSTAVQFSAWPSSETCKPLVDQPPAFNEVHLWGDEISILYSPA